ncbi:MAG: hypothetical protein ACRCXA_10070 [Peptostreptococcaceae bacterium]
MKFEVKPLDGIYWNDRKIRLGYTKDEVRSILGIPEICENIFYYFDNELSFHFNNEDKVEFIEFSSDVDGKIEPIIYARLAFKTLADELYTLLSNKNMGDIDDSESGYSFSFKNISVGLYRESTPNSVREMIQEMKNDGLDIENNEDVEIENKKSRYWSSLGIGVRDYYC